MQDFMIGKRHKNFAFLFKVFCKIKIIIGKFFKKMYNKFYEEK